MGSNRPDWGSRTRMAKGPFPAKSRIRGRSPTDWEAVPDGAYFCPQCLYVKSVRCTYRGHRSIRADHPDAPRIEMALLRGATNRTCLNPECDSPFLPLHERQVYCCDRCRERAKYLRRGDARGRS